MAKSTTKSSSSKKKVKKNVPVGLAYINCTFNNTVVTITDTAGNTISWSSAGVHGFKGSRKSTPFAAQVTGEAAARKAREVSGMRSVVAYVNGPGAGRESALRSINGAGLTITLIKDTTPVPHNGCRPKKTRRV